MPINEIPVCVIVYRSIHRGCCGCLLASAVGASPRPTIDSLRFPVKNTKGMCAVFYFFSFGSRSIRIMPAIREISVTASQAIPARENT